MSRLARVGLAVALLASVFLTARLADPIQTYACSCRIGGPDDLADIGGRPGMVVFIGTVQSLERGGDQFGHARGVMLVDWVFKGPIPKARMPVISGGGGDCTLPLQAGQRMVTVAPLAEGVITPGLCLPYADPGTPEGQQLIQRATEVFGSGAAPPGAPVDPTQAPAATDAGMSSDVLVWTIALAFGVVVVLFGSLTVVTRRSSRGRTT